jgi:hypothetical protein
MKIEFLADGAEDCPLIRIYDYRVEEIEILRQACRELAAGRIAEYRLHEQPWVDAMDGCRFTWRTGSKKFGVQRQSSRNEFVLENSEDGWRGVEGLLEPFATASTGGFQWLTSQGDVNVLISRSGTW